MRLNEGEVPFPSSSMNTHSRFSASRLVSLLAASLMSLVSQAATITWNGGSGGRWNDNMNWSPQQVPDANDTAVIGGTEETVVLVTGFQSVGRLVLDNPNATLRVVGRTFDGHTELTVADGFENRGTLEIASEGSANQITLSVRNGTLTNAVGGIIRIPTGTGTGIRRLSAQQLDNRGAVILGANLFLMSHVANRGSIHIPEELKLEFQTGVTWTHQGGTITGTGTIQFPPQSSSRLELETDFVPGTYALEAQGLTVSGPGKLLGPTTGELRMNQWTVFADVVVSGDMRVEGSTSINGQLSVLAGKTLRVVETITSGVPRLRIANGFENHGTIELASESGPGNTVELAVASGVLTNTPSGVLRATASGDRGIFEADIDNRGIMQAAEGIVLRGSLLNASSGALTGDGAYNFTLTTVTHEGTVAPGTPLGVMTIRGNLPHGQSSQFEVEIGGFTPGTQHDQLVLQNPATLGGAIRPMLVGGFVPKKDDAFTVLTYPSRTGAFAGIDNPQPDRIAWDVRYGPTSAQLVVLNTAPTLTAITNRSLHELTSLSVTASATDPDLPAQTLTYSLVEAPAGMTIHPTTGVISWTPTEAQGPGTHEVAVRVTDNGTPSLGHTTRFTMTVDEVNTAPQLVLPEPRTVDEQTELVFTLSGTDADLPANTLTYEFVSGPPGATFDFGTRAFRWTPTEADGPGMFTATFRVTDSNPDAVNAKQLSSEGIVSIRVLEANRPPILTAIAGQTVAEETPLAVSAAATDPDLPANALTYSLDSAPDGMTIHPVTGVIGWTPGETHGPGTFEVVVRATDNGTPALGGTTRFTVSVTEVNRPPELAAIPSATVHAGAPFAATLTATDPDLPANSFTYALVSGPADAAVRTDGQVTWTPPLADVGKVAEFTVRVSDGGTPAQTDDETFRITVAGPVEILSTTRNGDAWTIHWRAVAGNTYRLVRAPNLVPAEWTPLSEEVLATSDSASQTLNLGAENSAVFVRVERIR